MRWNILRPYINTVKGPDELKFVLKTDENVERSHLEVILMNGDGLKDNTSTSLAIYK